MNISNELLAAYAAGNVTNDERNAVRQYLAEHPQDLESAMMMLDGISFVISDITRSVRCQ